MQIPVTTIYSYYSICLIGKIISDEVIYDSPFKMNDEEKNHEDEIDSHYSLPLTTDPCVAYEAVKMRDNTTKHH